MQPQNIIRTSPSPPSVAENILKKLKTLNGRLPLEDSSDFDDPVLVFIVMTWSIVWDTLRFFRFFVWWEGWGADEGRAGWDVKFWSIYWEKSSFSRFAWDQTNLTEIKTKTKTKPKTKAGEPARGARSAPPVGSFTRFVFGFVFVFVFVLISVKFVWSQANREKLDISQ